MTDHGMVTVASGWPVGETLDRLQTAATAAGLLVFARIDHGAGAAGAGLELRGSPSGMAWAARARTPSRP